MPEPVVGGDTLPQLTGTLMPDNIESLNISPDGNQILYLIHSGANLLGFTSDLDGKNQKKVFSSAFLGWLSQWATPTDLLFTVKPTGYGDGFAYRSNLLKGGFTKVVGPVMGLTTMMSPDGKYVLISHNSSNGPSLGILASDSKKLSDTGLNSISDKCAWASDSTTVYCAIPAGIPRDGVYPDDWYQSEVSFSDAIWQITISPDGTTNPRLLFTPTQEGGDDTDGINLTVDKKNKYLYFENKKNNILWQYDLAPEPVQTSDTQNTTDTTTTPPPAITTQ